VWTARAQDPWVGHPRSRTLGTESRAGVVTAVTLLADTTEVVIPARSAPKRTQAERSEATRGQLVRTARDLFAADGYTPTSLDAVCRKAGVTKGALYHHFGGKRELFEAVYEAEEAALCAALAQGARKHADPWDGFVAGSRAFLEACLDPGVQRISLLDAPSVLDWERMQEIQAEYGLALMKQGLKQSAKAGRIRSRDIDGLAHLLFGAMSEGAMYIARASDQRAALRKMTRELQSMLDALAT
jgi:AcrR family transcriptional regulator